ncbi:CrcB family protein [Streptomyces sp. NPDC005438]|uniref:fluoride efflux transporter FluC n=1 Tax=Streptomyces sp. NPDC005438 TaxID=3156880 RepID=UPI0033ADB1CA
MPRNAPRPAVDRSTGPAFPRTRPPRRAWRAQAAPVAVVALGGGLGATARYAAAVLWPTPTGAFPWTTWAVNAVGCAVIGVFMVVITEVRPVHRLVRPFFGVGVLGGFTTFSTYAADLTEQLHAGNARPALAYLALTPLTALLAVWGGTRVTRLILAWRRS